MCQKTFVGHNLGENSFSDTQIEFSSANFFKIEDIIKNSNYFRGKFEKIKIAFENILNIEDISKIDDVKSIENEQELMMKAEYFVLRSRIEKEQKEFEIYKKKELAELEKRKRNVENEDVLESSSKKKRKIEK